MNIFDLLLAYHYTYQTFGKETADGWLNGAALDNKLPKWFIKEIQRCFDQRGDYIMESGESGSFKAMLIRSREK
jgi:hypothetical protein